MPLSPLGVSINWFIKKYFSLQLVLQFTMTNELPMQGRIYIYVSYEIFFPFTFLDARYIQEYYCLSPIHFTKHFGFSRALNFLMLAAALKYCFYS